MCQRHTPTQMFARPDPATQPDLALSYVFRGHGSWIACTACGLTGCVTAAGRVRWYTPGTVGHLSRDRDRERAAEWNQLVGTPTSTEAK